ncbi:hypothetical protein K7H20_24100 [Salipiger manganoxidans]|jgi:hypothetical protein|uniref:hypothetical protein n=1 Tax=Salipiger marinus TaxID=555512 RepID=UPI001E631DA1|nr:hypothetical protein [Salipiger manganoxidans]MCD1621124.1 hypothetical protein [Salipiger manganoxidans]|tara:strand:- start:66 stop:287 length:222 start_codon:yes stop_codon:yes gene_type:complete
MNTPVDQLRAEIEATARLLGLSPSTVGERAGQGGRFYTRLTEGKKVWPETVAAVTAKLQEMRANAASSKEAAE